MHLKLFENFIYEKKNLPGIIKTLGLTFSNEY